MISRFIAWIIELFRPTPKKQQELEQDVKKLEKKLGEIEDEELSDTDINNYLNGDS